MNTQDKPLTEEEMKNVFLTYRDSLYGFLLSRVKNPHDAEDLFSKSFMKFFDYAQKNPVRKDTMKAFLYRIAVNTANDFFRRKKIIRFVSLDRTAGSGEEESSFHDLFRDVTADGATDRIDRKELLRKISDSLSLLPEKQREVFSLRGIEGFSFAEIAGLQRTSVSTVLSRMRYAVEKVKSELAKAGMLEDR